MTIDSVAITRQAVLNPSNSTVRLQSTGDSGAVQLDVRPNALGSRVIQCGVQLPEAGVSSVSELMLKDELGQEVPAQYDIQGNWPDGSIKSALVAARVTPDPVNKKTFNLEYGAGVTQSSYSSNLSMTESTTEYVISTGKIRATLDKTTGQLIKSVYADTAGDQSYATQLLGQSEISSVNALNQVEYLASNEVAPTWSVKRNGTKHISLQAVGYLRDNTNAQYTEFRVWFEFYDDCAEINIKYTMVDKEDNSSNLRPAMYEHDVEFAASNLIWNFNHQLSSNLKYIFGGESANAIGDLSGYQHLFQSGNWTIQQNGRITADPASSDNERSGNQQVYSGVQEGKRSKGFCTLHNGTVGVTLMIKHMWQRWPKELGMDDGSITAGLWPDRYHGGSPTTIHSVKDDGEWVRPNTLFHVRHGMAKTYEMKLLFHTSTPDAENIERIKENYESLTPDLLATSQHYCTNKHLFDLIPMDSDSSTHFNALHTNVLHRSLLRYPDHIEPFGDRDWGDRYRTAGWEITSPVKLNGFLNGAHIGAINYYLLYFRTMEEDWLYEGYRETRYFMDLAVCHSNFTNRSKLAEYEPFPPGLIQAASHKDIEHATRNGHTGHWHLSGLVPHYWLTGDQRAYEVLEEIAKYLEHTSQFDFRVPRPVNYSSDGLSRGFIEAERDFGWPFYIAIEWVKVSNSSEYFMNVTTQMMKFLVSWWQTPDDHVLIDVVIGRSDWEQGTGYWLLDNTDNGPSGTYSNGPQPWISGSIFHPAVEWHKLDERFNSGVDRQLVRNMLYQCMQFLFTWTLSPDDTHFYYSEARKGDPDDPELSNPRPLISPLTWIYLKYKEDLSAGNIEHPEWFDHELWKRVLINNYRILQSTGSPLYSHGFYGYENVFPGEFWKNMKIIEAEV